MNILIDLLYKTAWPSATLRPYGAFHLIFSGIGIAAAAALAFALAGLLHRQTASLGGQEISSSGPEWPWRLLFLCGLFLALGELYKQLFLYYVVRGGSYDWWYFPFQLCSMPMYLCLLTPLWKKGAAARRIVCTFLKDFGLLGGVMALAEPSGLFHPYWTLTIHGLLWHIILIFISLFIARSGLAGRTNRDYLNTLPLLAFFCLIATAINVATSGAADMFYISPYYPVTQVVFHSIALRYGNAAGIAVYLASICAGGYICHTAVKKLERRGS